MEDSPLTSARKGVLNAINMAVALATAAAEWQVEKQLVLTDNGSNGTKSPVAPSAEPIGTSPILLAMLQSASEAIDESNKGNIVKAMQAAVMANVYAASLHSRTVNEMSTGEAAKRLAGASKAVHVAKKDKFLDRFAELGMTKNRAAEILAKEFGLTTSTARKKLQPGSSEKKAKAQGVDK